MPVGNKDTKELSEARVQVRVQYTRTIMRLCSVIRDIRDMDASARGRAHPCHS